MFLFSYRIPRETYNVAQVPRVFRPVIIIYEKFCPDVYVQRHFLVTNRIQSASVFATKTVGYDFSNSGVSRL